MSWLAEPVLLQREFFALAAQVGGWGEGTTRSQMQAVFKRARMVAHGETVEWQEQAIDARYRFKTETILEWLAITPEEQAHLQTLISREEARARHRNAERARKHETGEVEQDRQEYLVQHTASEARTTAYRLRQEGQSISAIAKHLGITRQRVQQYLKEGCKGSVRLYGGES